MRTLHVGLRVTDLERSLAFYAALGYEVVGSVPDTPIGHLTMLKLPDDDFVTVELVSAPTDGRTSALSHLVVQVESLDIAAAELVARDVHVEPTSPAGDDAIRTTIVTDPDGNHIELVQWPPGHPDGMTAADFA